MSVVDQHGAPVLLRAHDSSPAYLSDLADLEDLAEAALEAARNVPRAAIELARSLTSALPHPGSGETLALWEALASVAAADVAVARALEPHLDARAILAEADLDDLHREGSWGVYAAEGPGVRVDAVPDATAATWTLTGTKPWCSLASSLTHALVTAWVDGEQRGLFAVDLHQPGVHVLPKPWPARGLVDVPSGPVELIGVRSVAVGKPGWYLERDGFAWGGLGVAAVWYGAAVGVARRVRAAAEQREPDQVALMHLGSLDAALFSARSVLVAASAEVDAGAAAGPVGALLALRVRQVVADVCENVLRTADHALGPAPLALEEPHARRVADLRLYLRQHHAERDLAALGRHVADRRPAGRGTAW